MAATKTVRTTTGLCDALFSEFDALKTGRSDPKKSMVLAKLALGIVSTKRLELDALALAGQGKKARTPKQSVLRLGS